MAIKKVDKKYRKWIREQRCAACDRFAENYIANAHMRCLGRGGMGMKPPDKDLLPLCTIPGIDCHGREHQKGTVSLFGKKTKPRTKKYVQKLCDGYIKAYEGTKE